MPGKIPLRSRILFKGLAFILIPCAVNTLFCIKLFQLQAEAEDFGRQEHTHMAIVRHANSIMTLYGAASGQLATYAQSGEKAALDRGHEYVAKLDKEYEELVPLLRSMPVISDKTLLYRKEGATFLKELEAIGDGRSQGSEDISDTFMRLKQHGLMRFIYNASITSRAVTDLAIAQEAELESTRDKGIIARAQARTALSMLIALNLLMALLCGAYFFFSITRRLSVLMQNAQRLPTLLPLNERVTGGDELEYLDGILHDAAGELRNASEQRRYLMEMVAHDIRSPLMSSQVSLEVLSDERIGDLPPMAKRQVNALHTNIKRVISLTTDLLEVDKLEVGRIEISKESIDIFTVVEESLQGLNELARKKNITLVNECPHQTILADRLRLGQVLTNIVSNAIKFSPENQWIRIIGVVDSYLTVSVIDNGPGIAKKDQQRIFDKYAQLENGTGKGFGLGLAICKLIIDSHGGAIGVTNENGAGARFWFRLPLAKLQ